jgi:hypothetical protein
VRGQYHKHFTKFFPKCRISNPVKGRGREVDRVRGRGRGEKERKGKTRRDIEYAE